MFLGTLLFDWPRVRFVGKSQRCAFAHQVLCTDDASIAYTLNVLRW